MAGPAPRLKIEVPETPYLRACRELQIIPPQLVIREGGQKLLGQYHWPANVITIFTAYVLYETDALRYVQSEIVETLLHELRHGYQWQNELWPTDVVKRETDANHWASTRVADYRDMVRVRRITHGSGMSKLSNTERRIRYNQST